MMPSRLKAFLDQSSLDALLLIGDSICDPDIYYLSHFLATDRFTLLARDRIILLVSSMEKGRASKESSADEVVSTSDYGIMERLRSTASPEQAYLQTLTEFLRDHDALRLGIPPRFPAGVYQHLCRDFRLSIIDSPVSRWRAVKTAEELEAIRSAQTACERAMRRAVHLIASSQPRGEALYRQGEPLTSEMVRSEIEVVLLREGCEAVDTIVAGGAEAADPHARGTGILPANAPIVIDIFPRSKSSRYFADMTRTVLKGQAPAEVKDLYQAVLEAQVTALKAVRAGVSGKEVHSQVSQVFQDLGYHEREGKGFIHSTGHGLGLEVHERPSLSEAGEVLEPNNVVTVEPGLYYPQIGGVRLEDLVIVTARGCENLTHFEKRLEL